MLSRTTGSSRKDQLAGRWDASPKPWALQLRDPCAGNTDEKATDVTWRQDGCWRKGEALPGRTQQGGIAVVLKDPWPVPSSFTLHAPLLRLQASKMPRSFLPTALLTCCSLTIQQTCNESLPWTKSSLCLQLNRSHAAHMLA